MNVHSLKIDKSGININPSEILYFLGNGEGLVDLHTEEIEIEGIRFQTGLIINSLLRNAEEFAFIVATAGSAPESLARILLEEGQYLEGYIVDLIGSVVVESVATQVHEHIRGMAA